jgi:hypothetical protein
MVSQCEARRTRLLRFDRELGMTAQVSSFRCGFAYSVCGARDQAECGWPLLLPSQEMLRHPQISTMVKFSLSISLVTCYTATTPCSMHNTLGFFSLVRDLHIRLYSLASQLIVNTTCLERPWATLSQSLARRLASPRLVYKLVKFFTTTTRNTKVTTMTSTTCCDRSKACRVSSTAYVKSKIASRSTIMNRRRSCIWRSKRVRRLWQG